MWNQRMLAIVRSELKMRLRSKGFIFVVLFANALAVFIASPLNNTDAQSVSSSWYLAGQTFWVGALLMTLIGGLFVADRISRDKVLMTDEVIWSRPVRAYDVVAGKYLAMVVAMLISGIPMVVISPIMQAAILRKFQPEVFVLAYLLIFTPGIIFITSLSLACGTFFGKLKIYYFVFAGYWLFSSNVLFNLGDSPLRYLIYTGQIAYQLFESQAYHEMKLPPWAITKMPPFSQMLGDFIINISILIILSWLFFFALMYFERYRRGV